MGSPPYLRIVYRQFHLMVLQKKEVIFFFLFFFLHKQPFRSLQRPAMEIPSIHEFIYPYRAGVLPDRNLQMQSMPVFI